MYLNNVGSSYFVVTIIALQIAHNMRMPMAVWKCGCYHVDYKSKLTEIHDLCAYDVSTQEADYL